MLFSPIRLGLAVAFAASLACGGGATPPIQAAPATSAPEVGTKPFAGGVYFVPGESMRWELSLRGIVGGEARMAIGEPGLLDGKSVVISRSRTETVGLVAAIKKVRDDVITHVEVTTGAPIYNHADVVFGDKEAVIESQFEGAHAEVKYQRKAKRLRKYRMRLPEGQSLFEAHSILMGLRAWDPKPGERAYFYVVAGRRLWRNDVTAVGVETIKTKMGTFKALRIDGVARRQRRSLKADPLKKPRPFSMWISADQARRPLLVTGQVELGEVRAELVEHTQPPQQVAVTH